MNTSTGARWPWPIFLVLAYGITWAVQIPAYLYLVPRGTAPTNEANFLLLSTGGMDPGTATAVLLLCFSFGPSVAGVVVVALESGRPGLRDLFVRLVKARIPGKVDPVCAALSRRPQFGSGSPRHGRPSLRAPGGP